MTIKEISVILDNHFISHKRSTQTSLDNARIQAEEVYTLNGVAGSNWVDVTDYTAKKLFTWLGY